MLVVENLANVLYIKFYICFTDVNECTSGNNNCSIYANCENKIGSYICVCKQEYSGDGYICEGM